MNDRELERRIGAWFRPLADEGAPATLRAVADTIPDLYTATPVWRRPLAFPSLRVVLLLALLTALAASSGLILAGRPSVPAPVPGGLLLAYAADESVSREDFAACYTPVGVSRCDFGATLFTLDPGTGTRTTIGTLAVNGPFRTGHDFLAPMPVVRWFPGHERVFIGGENLALNLASPATVPEVETSEYSNWTSFAMSPSGDRFAGVGRDINAHYQIWIKSPDTGELLQFFAPEGAFLLSAPTWAPDESAVAIAACHPCGADTEVANSLLVFPLEDAQIAHWREELEAGRSPARLLATADEEFGAPTWLPDGSAIVAPLGRSLVKVSATSGAVSVVAQLDGFVDDGGSYSVSPDGRRVALSTVPNRFGQRAFGPTVGSGVQVIALDGGEHRALTAGPVVVGGWSPDGQWILYSVPDWTSPSEYWIAPLNGGPPRFVGELFGAAW